MNSKVEKTIREAHTETIKCEGKDLRIFVCQDEHTIDDVSEKLKDSFDIFLAFRYQIENKVPHLVVSCRSQTFDVGDFAKSLGGRGHSKAADFKLLIGSSVNPYRELHEALTSFMFRYYFKNNHRISFLPKRNGY